MLRLSCAESLVKPLSVMNVASEGGAEIQVRDAQGVCYVTKPLQSSAEFTVSGALGTQVVSLCDSVGKVLETASFRVDCSTEISDETTRSDKLLSMLKYTMTSWCEGSTVIRLDGKFYNFFVCWLRDHVHTLKGMKYFFAGDLKTGIELYGDYQREDGLIWDRIERYGREQTWRDFTFSYGGFVTAVDDGTWRFERIPVENDVEYLFVEGLYYTWKATGDNAWMGSMLDKAIKACRYSMSDPYRWSEKYGLLKRGYTIDTWDFQSAEDAKVRGEAMAIDKDKTHFGIMHGDNTGFIAGCRYLAQMLTAAGRSQESAEWETLATTLQARLDKLAWNGKFFTHHVPEHPQRTRDLGVDESTQVSLSNTYDMNRGITHEQCCAIVKTYQEIAREMPASSPGEFYMIYPPFEKGFGGHNEKWHYMNGGVTTIVAGELAHGAFEHGHEHYGAQILDKVLGWGEAHDGYLHCTLRGAMPSLPTAKFTKIDLRSAANCDIAGTGAPGVPGWIGEGSMDLAAFPVGEKVFETIPYDVIDPSTNARRACLGVSSAAGYKREITVGLDRKAASLYLLHTLGKGSFAGWVTLNYANGQKHTVYINSGREVGGWFMPKKPTDFSTGSSAHLRLAWRGRNEQFDNIGVFQFGIDNPHPDTVIESVSFTASEEKAIWFILGLTISDKQVFFTPNDLSHGIPDNWGAAAVVYALVEGLAGVKDTGVAFDSALIAPRWAAFGATTARATIKYEASGGYVAYTYRFDQAAEKLFLEVAGCADTTTFRVLLPQEFTPRQLSVSGTAEALRIEKVENSPYAVFELRGRAAHSIVIS